MQTYRQTGMTNLMVAFRNFANTLTNHTASHTRRCYSEHLENPTTLVMIFERFKHVKRMDEETRKHYLRRILEREICRR